MTRVIEVMILDGAMPSSVALTLDLLATANRLRQANGSDQAFAVKLIGSAAECWTRLVPAALPVSAMDGRDVIVPGLSLTSKDEIEPRLARDDAKQAIDQLSSKMGSHAFATSCSGAFLFAKAGLLADRSATTSWWLAPVFGEMFPDVRLDTQALVVRDGQIATAGAALAQMDLMLSLVSDWAGPAMAAQCGRFLLLDERRSQAHYMALSFLAASDPHVAQAETWARANIAHGFSVNDLAEAAGLAPRTFARRLEKTTGLSPIKFVQRLRVEIALELLDFTQLAFDEVAARVGYSDPGMLRQLITAQTGLSPKRHRRQDRRT